MQQRLDSPQTFFAGINGTRDATITCGSLRRSQSYNQIVELQHRLTARSSHDVASTVYQPALCRSGQNNVVLLRIGKDVFNARQAGDILQHVVEWPLGQSQFVERRGQTAE